MKLSFKNILVIFLIALLGGSLGTIASNEILEIRANKEKELEKEDDVVLESISYEDFTPSDLSQTIEKAIDTVVIIQSTVTTQSFYGTYTGTSAGSGVFISEDGYIVTNHHVIEDGTDIKVTTYDGTEYDAEVIGSDSRCDIAVLKVTSDTSFAYSKFADSDQIILGQEVIAIGNPLGQGITVTNGIISSLAKEITINNFTMEVLQTNADINSGNSGGGLFDINANLIGIVNAKTFYSTSSTVVEGMGYAIPSNTAKRIVEDLINYGYVKNRATLGISVYKNSNSYYYQTYSGCIVSNVVEGGAAEEAGIKVGDNITYIDDNAVTSYTELVQVLDKYEVGDTVEITLVRNNKTMKLKATLKEATS